MIRILALVLVLILALGIIPLGALAVTVDVFRDYFDTVTPTLGTPPISGEYAGQKTGTTSVTIKTSDYDKYLIYNGEVYDRKGFIDWNEMDKLYSGTTPPSLDTPLPLTSSLTFTNSSMPFADLVYVPHQHKLSRWYSDGTTHWRECLVCKQLNPSHETMFMYQNWCQGGKITVNRDNASHRMKITADVDVADGYTLHKLHFTKVRPDGSKQEVVRYGSGKSFWTNMPTYPMEVTAEFVKK